MDSRIHELANRAIQYATKQGVQYCDARAEQQTGKSLHQIGLFHIQFHHSQ